MRLVGVAFLILLFTSVAYSDGVSLTFLNDSTVSEPTIVLGDIADVKGEKRAVNRIKEIPFDISPQMNKSIKYSKREVLAKLRSHSKVLHGMTFNIPKEITVKRGLKTLTERILKPLILEAVKREMQEPEWEARLSDLKIPKNIALDKGVEVVVAPFINLPRGSSLFEIQFHQNGDLKTRRWIRGRIDYHAKVPVLTRSVSSQSRIRISDIKWKKKNITNLRGKAPRKEELLLSFARRHLSAGTILTKESLQRQKAIKYGEEVILEAGDDSFSVSSRGIAQQAGHIGDVIKIKNMNKKMISGLVVAKGKVKVRY